MYELELAELEHLLKEALDKAERLSQKINDPWLAATFGKQLEDFTILELKRLAYDADAIGGIPTLRRTIATYHRPSVGVNQRKSKLFSEIV